MLDNGEEGAKIDRASAWRSALSPLHFIARKLRDGLAMAWRWRYRIVGIGAVAGILWFFGGPILFGVVVIADPVVRADFVQTVVASGHVEAPFRVNIGTQITGVVAEVPVNEGQTVKTGDTLIVLDDREARAAVVEAEGAVAQADAKLRQMQELTLPSAEEALKQAKATLVNAEASNVRAVKLAAHGYGTKAVLDDAIRALNIARAAVRNAEFQVYTSRPGGSDYVMVETQRDQSRANLAAAKSRLSHTVVTAPRDGILISRDVERGNVVQPSNVLMKLSPFGDTQLVVQIDEKNLGLIAVGQKALASADAFPKDTFPAEIVYINPAVDLQRASVEVKLRVPEPPSYLRQDMTISVDIETARRAGALLLPVTDIRGQAAGKPWVMKVAGGRATRQPVKIGLTSGGKAEILDGVAQGDFVIPPPSLAIKAGQRVRVRERPEKPS